MRDTATLTTTEQQLIDIALEVLNNPPPNHDNPYDAAFQAVITKVEDEPDLMANTPAGELLGNDAVTRSAVAVDAFTRAVAEHESLVMAG